MKVTVLVPPKTAVRHILSLDETVPQKWHFVNKRTETERGWSGMSVCRMSFRSGRFGRGGLVNYSQFEEMDVSKIKPAGFCATCRGAMVAEKVDAQMDLLGATK